MRKNRGQVCLSVSLVAWGLKAIREKFLYIHKKKAIFFAHLNVWQESVNMPNIECVITKWWDVESHIFSFHN